MKNHCFYIAAMSSDPTGGIYRFALDERGAVEQRSFTALPNTGYLAFSPTRQYLYATCAVADDIGGCAAYRVDEQGALTLLNKAASDGPSSCHLTTDPSGCYLYCANYRSSSITEFRLATDGTLLEPARTIRHSGKSVHPERQLAPHPHFTMLTPDARYLCVIDLGIDAIVLYPFNPADGIDSENPRFFKVTPAGAGPRHLVFNRAGNRAYLLNELGNSVTACTYADGEFTYLKTLSSLPTHLPYPTKAAAIRLSEDERFLFASNRGFDTIACYRVEQATGDLELYDFAFSGGSSPRDINFLADPTKFAAANEFSDIVTFFDYAPDTGKLTPNGQAVKLPRPLAICHPQDYHAYGSAD